MFLMTSQQDDLSLMKYRKLNFFAISVKRMSYLDIECTFYFTDLKRMNL